MTTPSRILEQFRQDGFVKMPGLFSGDSLEVLQENISRFIADVMPSMPAEKVFFENRNDTSSLKQIQQLGEYDCWFDQLLHQGLLRDIAEECLDGPVVPKNLQYFNKPPGVSRATPPHQDGFYFMLEPCLAITMWLALDPVDQENGCVQYVKGSHRRGMRRHQRTQTLGFSQGIADYFDSVDREDEIAVPAQPGDLLVHDALTIHRANENRSKNRSRRALGFIYYSATASVNEAAHEAYQRQLADEMKTIE